MTEPGVVLGLDHGTTRIGVAGSDPGRLTAFPIEVIPVDDALWDRVCAIAEQRQATLVVVGLPVSLSGDEGHSAVAARRFAHEVGAATGLPVVMADERFTTSSAENLLIGSNVKRRKRRQVIDAVAAAVMLQSYLDAQET